MSNYMTFYEKVGNFLFLVYYFFSSDTGINQVISS